MRPSDQACRGHCNTIIKHIAAFQNDVNQIDLVWMAHRDITSSD